MRFAGAGPILSLLAVACWAQPPAGGRPDAAQARTLLHSAALKDKAWGAYFAARLRAPDLAADILEEFRADAGLAGARHNSGEYAFLAALFDAAIETGAQVPAAVLQPYEKKWDESVLILLALNRVPDREEAFLRMTGSRPDLIWLAANNLLFEMKSQKWYAKTLQELRIGQHFTVLDHGPPPGKSHQPLSGVCGDALIRFPKGFPPITFYVLETQPSPGFTKLASGPIDVSYQRVVVPADTQGGFGPCFSVDRAKVSIDYLAALANVPYADTEELFHRETVIHYLGVSQFQRDIQRSVASQEQEIQALIQAIQRSEQLVGSGVEMHIFPQFTDQRQNQTEPLPTVQPQRIVLRDP